MVQVNLDFAPSGPAMLGQSGDKRLVVLLRGIEVGMNERAPFRIAVGSEPGGVFAAPAFQSAFLFSVRSEPSADLRHDRRFEVVSQSKN